MMYERVTAPGKDIIEPDLFDYDGCVRREPVYDHNFHPPRLIRRVGWRMCLCCGDPFFSRDVVKVRLCDPCKAPTQVNVYDEASRERMRTYHRAWYRRMKGT